MYIYIHLCKLAVMSAYFGDFRIQLKMPRDLSGSILVYTHFQQFICRVHVGQRQLHFPVLTQLNSTPIHLNNIHLE